MEREQCLVDELSAVPSEQRTRSQDLPDRSICRQPAALASGMYDDLRIGHGSTVCVFQPTVNEPRRAAARADFYSGRIRSAIPFGSIEVSNRVETAYEIGGQREKSIRCACHDFQTL